MHYFINKLIRKFKFIRSRRPVYNLGNRLSDRRVLISYLSDFLWEGLDSYPYHTNRVEADILINSFIKQGWVVDVVSCDSKINLKHDYDLIFGFGKPYRSLKSKTKTALYLTENIPSIAQGQEYLAIKNYNAKYSTNTNLVRANRFYTEDDMYGNDYIVALSDSKRINQVSAYCKRSFSLLPTGLIDSEFVPERNIRKSKLNFLWFGSGGAILKGLDILCDVFNHRSDITLHVAGLSDTERDLIKSNSFVDHGKVKVGSEEFRNLVNTCSFLILPSWSEGCPTSVLTGLRHGMIPIVSQNCSLNDLNGVFIFDEISKAHIEKLVNTIVRIPDEDLKYLHSSNLKNYKDEFGISRFTNDVDKIVSDISKDFYK